MECCILPPTHGRTHFRADLTVQQPLVLHSAEHIVINLSKRCISDSELCKCLFVLIWIKQWVQTGATWVTVRFILIAERNLMEYESIKTTWKAVKRTLRHKSSWERRFSEMPTPILLLRLRSWAANARYYEKSIRFALSVTQ